MTDFWFPHAVTVRDYQEGAGEGPSFGRPRPLNAEVKDEQRLIRTATGEQAVSSSTVTVPLNSAVAPGSRVTMWAGTSAEREASVIAVARHENDEFLPSHLILSLE